MKKLLQVLVNTPASLARGLRVTWANLVRAKTTQGYPEEMPVPMGQGPGWNAEDPFDQPYEIAPRFRGLHALTRDPETGDLNCIGCMACANVCPDDLISMDLEKREGHNGRYPVTFTVNIGPCCFCGLCAEVCPTPMRAIVMTDLFEWATFERSGLNLVLTKEDLERNGEYEVERRAKGRQWGGDGELLGVNPEEEGNPYFQFAPESGKAERMERKKTRADEAKPEAAPAAERQQVPTHAADTAPAAAEAASPAAAADPLEQVRTAFEAAGVAVPSDVHAFDLSSLDAVEDRKLRAQAKSALAKARKALGEQAPAPAEQRSDDVTEAPVAPASPPAAEDPLAAVRVAFEAAGLPVPDDLHAFDLTTLDAIEDRKLRGQAKSAVVRARKATEGQAAAPAPSPEATAAPVEAPSTPAAEASGPGPAPTPAPEAVDLPEQAAVAPAGLDDAEALRAKLVEVLNQAGVPVPDQPETLELEALDGIDDRKLRGQAKSSLRRLQRALGLVD